MLDIFGNILEFFSSTLICCTLLNKKFQKSIYFVIIFPYLLCNIFTDITFILYATIMIIFIKLYFNVNTITSVYTYASNYFILVALQCIFVTIDALFIQLNSDTITPLIGPIYTLIASYLVYRFASFINKLFVLLFETGRVGKFVIINLYAITTIIVLYFHANMTTYYENILFVIAAFSIMIILNILLSNQLGKIKEQEQRLNAYTEYLPVLEDLIHTVRVRQHNYNNQLQAIAGLLYTQKDYQSLSTALEEQFKVASSSDVPEYLLKVNLPVVAGFLYQKSNEAKKYNKALALEFNTYNLVSKAPEYDLIEMFGILIDNAIEAIPEGSTVYVSVDCDGTQITFCTRNAGYILSPDDRKNFFSKGFSEKKDNKPHSGLGLYQLNQLIKQYPLGSVALWNEGTDILFKIVV